jgi:ATP-binding cassette subfamily F protein uup
MRQPADVLILDEPTNDLDIPSLEVLESSLSDFPGTLILVTHDRYMLDRLCTELLALEGEDTGFYADYAQWERVQAEREAAGKAAIVKAAPKPAPRPDTLKPAKKLTWKEERELEGMELTILTAEAEVEAALQAMQDPAVLADHAQLRAWSERHHAAELHVAALYARWQDLEEKAQSVGVKS